MIEDSLEEDLLHDFKDSTLMINSDGKPNNDLLIKTESPDKSIDNSETATNNTHWPSKFISPLTSIPNKISATLWSKNCTSVSSTKNAIQETVQIGENPNDYFAIRESVLARALNECKEQFLNEEADGPLLEAFLLTQITHWNADKERLLLLTSKFLVICKYDYIALRRLAYQKLSLDIIEEINYGDLVYPSGSLIPNRNMKGVRLIWGKNKPMNFGSYWNPFNDDIPFCTFTFHPLFYHKDSIEENVKKLYCLDNFIERISKAIQELPPRNDIKPDVCTIQEKDIMLKTYMGIGSIIHNRNGLGFFKVRGKLSF